MTSVREKKIHTTEVSGLGTESEVRTAIEALRQHRLTGEPPRQRMVVDARPLPRRVTVPAVAPLRRPLVVGVASAFPTAAIAGWITWAAWGDLIVSALTTLGSAAAFGLLVYAAVGLVAHRMPGHSCARPGCGHH